jgi:uncharacterized membrane protein
MTAPAALPVWFHEAVVAPAAVIMAMLHATRALGWKHAAVELGALIAYGFVLEKTAMVVFSSHRYAIAWKVAPLGVPIAVAAVWAALIVSGLAVTGRRGLASPLSRAAGAAGLGISLDLLMEPVAVRAGLWEWTPPGPWLGVPIGNFVGWAVIVGAYVLGAELWGESAFLWGQVMRRLSLAGGAIVLLVVVGLAWKGGDAESAFGGLSGWVVCTTLLLATASLGLAHRLPPNATTLGVRLGALRPHLPNGVFLGVGTAFAVDACALRATSLVVAATGTLLTLLVALPDAWPAQAARRWRAVSLSALAKVEGLVHVLMKPRNRQPWSREDREFLRSELRALARWTPALVLFMVPGSFVLLSAYAWILDRRRGLRPTSVGTGS